MMDWPTLTRTIALLDGKYPDVPGSIAREVAWDALKDDFGIIDGDGLQIARLALAGRALAEAVRAHRAAPTAGVAETYPPMFAALAAWDVAEKDTSQ